MRPDFVSGPRRIRAAAVVAAARHVQNCGADVFHQFALHRSAVVVLDAGGDIPEAHVFSAAAHAAPAPDALVAKVGAVLVFVFVLSLVEATGPQGHFGGSAEDGYGRAAGNLHQPIAGGIDAHPIENRTGVNIVARFA